jgi:hypothetical protein
MRLADPLDASLGRRDDVLEVSPARLTNRRAPGAARSGAEQAVGVVGADLVMEGQ